MLSIVLTWPTLFGVAAIALHKKNKNKGLVLSFSQCVDSNVCVCAHYRYYYCYSFFGDTGMLKILVGFYPYIEVLVV